MQACHIRTRWGRPGPIAQFVGIFCAALVLGISAQGVLYVEVDKATQTYYVSGSASGTPEDTVGYGVVSFNNGQPYSDAYTNLFSLAMFQVSDNTMNYLTFYLHADGNINGSWNFESTAYCTVTGNPGVRLSYAGFAAALIAELESKADAMETLPVTRGSSTLAMTFRNAPIPTYATIVEFSNGSITWTNLDTNLYYTVEWCPGLDTNAWTGSYSGLQNVRSTQGVIRLPVPMFFRVVGYAAPQ